MSFIQYEYKLLLIICFDKLGIFYDYLFIFYTDVSSELWLSVGFLEIVENQIIRPFSSLTEARERFYHTFVFELKKQFPRAILDLLLRYSS